MLHRDLKPANVLLGPAPRRTAKLSDFGEARQLKGADGTLLATTGEMTMVGTPLYMAPEALRRERYGAPADVFAFGGVLVNIATRRPPCCTSDLVSGSRQPLSAALPPSLPPSRSLASTSERTQGK